MIRKQRVYLVITTLIAATILSSCIPSPDLVWTGDFILTPPVPNVGDKVHIKQTWSNAGSTPISSAFDIRLEIRRENSPVFEQYMRVHQPVAPSEERTIDMTPEYVIPELGVYQITLTLDAKGVIAESRELNNVAESDSLSVVSFSKEADMAILAQAKEDIERYRKGDVTITIIDTERQPCSGLTVKYTQTQHSFLFGTFCISSEERVWALLKQAGLNYIAVWLGWDSVEPEPGTYSLDTDRIHFLRQFDFVGMGHCLIFLLQQEPSSTPIYVKDLSYEEYKQVVYPHIHKVIDQYKGEIKIWNVFNEPMLTHTNTLGLTEEQTIEVTKEGVRAIRDADPEGRILINNYNPGGESPGTHPYDFIQDAIRAGVDFDIIGLEFYYNAYNLAPLHLHPRRSLSSMGGLIDKYSTLGKKIQVTEISVPSAPVKGMQGYWGEPWSENLQAEYLETAYTIFFGKPQLEAIIWWDATDIDSFIYHGGLLDEQHRPKKSYYALKNLIRSWTTIGTGLTDRNGQITFRGFGGSYQVVITNPDTGLSKKQEIKIEEQKDNLMTIVLD